MRQGILLEYIRNYRKSIISCLLEFEYVSPLFPSPMIKQSFFDSMGSSVPFQFPLLKPLNIPHCEHLVQLQLLGTSIVSGSCFRELEGLLILKSTASNAWFANQGELCHSRFIRDRCIFTRSLFVIEFALVFF